MLRLIARQLPNDLAERNPATAHLFIANPLSVANLRRGHDLSYGGAASCPDAATDVPSEASAIAAVVGDKKTFYPLRLHRSGQRIGT